MTDDPLEIFREKAVQFHRSGRGARGSPLQLSPRWTGWTYWLIVTATAAALLFIVFFRVGEYASGPVVVRTRGIHDLTADQEGTVSAVLSEPGQRVDAGDVLIEFVAHQERAEFDRASQKLELRIAERLTDPLRGRSQPDLAALEADREFARRRLEARLLRAPSPGIVGDIRVRAGQRVEAGQIAVRLIGDSAGFTAIAVLPGHFRPRLRDAASLRVELTGYPHAFQEASIVHIGQEVLGPAECRRVLGQEIADAVPIPGSAVLVEAKLPGTDFRFGGKVYPFHDGMQGTAGVRVRTESILLTLWPALRNLERGGG